MKNNKIIIFGGMGFIGFNIAKKLCENGFECDIVDIKKNELKYKFLKNKYIDKVNLFLADVSKPNSIKKIKFKNYSYIFDCAATLGVERIIKNSLSSFQNNINIALHIAEFATRQKKLKKIIFMSSSEVYDGNISYKIKKPPNKEDTFLSISNLYHPRTVYMLSKIVGEVIYINSKLPYLNLRLHNVIGPDMYKFHGIPTFIRKIKFNKKLNFFNKNHIRSYIFIEEALEQIIKLSLNKKIKNEAINIGNQKNIFKNKSIITLIMKLMNVKKKIYFKNDNRNSINIRIPSTKKLQKKINLNYNKNFEDDLKKTIEFFEKKNEKK